MNFFTGYAPSSPSSTGVLTVGQIGNYGYGSMTMEKSFRVSDDKSVGKTVTLYLERATLKLFFFTTLSSNADKF